MQKVNFAYVLRYIYMYRCSNNPKNLKGLTVNLVLGLSNNVLMLRFAFLQNESLWIALTFYGINSEITNLDLF